MFFAETQNKLLYVVTKHTTTELVIARANANQPNMALTSWTGAVVCKQDIIIAKNYLTQDEIDSLNRLVVIFLETAELRVKYKKNIPISFWKQNIDKILVFNNKSILQGGAISNFQMGKSKKNLHPFRQKQKKARNTRNTRNR